MTTPTIVREFREGLDRGELLIQQCSQCGKPNMYPRYACPHCQSEELGWKQSAGEGTLMSCCTLRYGAPDGYEQDLPYALGIVVLDEGVQILARLAPDADGDWTSYDCDQRVAFSPNHTASNGRPCAVFGHAEPRR